MSKVITLTDEILEMAKSDNGGWSKKQFDLIGVKWPPKSGWKDKVLGVDYPYSELKKFIDLKNKHTNKRG